MTELRALTPHSSIPAEQSGRDRRQKRLLRTFLPELVQLERQLAEAPEFVQTTVAGRASVQDMDLPIYRVDLGSARPDVPVLLMVGGVHGLERIGSQVVTAWLESLLARLGWDGHLAALLQKVHITVLPILNPGGMYLNQRSNPNGVDLMRNAPITAQDRSAFLLGGQRFSARLPWYTGDQIWFPYAYRRRPMRRIGSVMALKLIWEKAYPNHSYHFEPQSAHYLTHGDLWDYFYKQVNRENQGVFLPLTLEMGSWRWIRKRPRQLLRLDGFFNPLVPHRHQRVLRSHLTWMDFLLNAAASHRNWLPSQDEESMLREAAIMHWYRDTR